MRARDPFVVLASLVLIGAATVVCAADGTAGGPGAVYTVAVSGTT